MTITFDTNRAHQARFTRARIRRLNSARSMSFAVPASISARRRRISISQAFSTLGSGVPSRIATSYWARSTRSGSDSFRTSARSFSKVGLLMLGAPHCDERIVHSTAYGSTDSFHMRVDPSGFCAQAKSVRLPYSGLTTFVCRPEACS